VRGVDLQASQAFVAQHTCPQGRLFAVRAGHSQITLAKCSQFQYVRRYRYAENLTSRETEPRELVLARHVGGLKSELDPFRFTSMARRAQKVKS
jgi:hypothetical protein